MAQRPVRRYRFGRYELWSDQRRLLADGATVPLGSRALDLLEALVEAAGALVAKDTLMDRLWGHVAVGDNTLQVHMSALRRALGPDAGAIVTEQGRGYRFVAPVTALEAASLPTPDEQPGPAPLANLPQAPARLIGRDADVAAVTALLGRERLVTITGPGGIGKTTLALAVGRAVLADQSADFPDGVWFAELAGLEDPALVPSTVATALGLRLSGTVTADALAGALEQRALLLLLDNCEHVVAEAAALAQHLIEAGPGLRVLATSREALRAAGEQIHALQPLGLSPAPVRGAEDALTAPAIELFVERARAADAGFALDDRNAQTIATICRRLDGIALALELAATQVPLLGLEALESRLDERFRVLVSGRRTALPRHQTLRAALDWSHDLLAEDERLLLRRLAIFSGLFTLAAAETVAADEALPEWEIIGPLTSLVAKSLLVLDRTEGEARYRLLETMRAYALEKLEAAVETAALRQRHAAYQRQLWEGLSNRRVHMPEPVWHPAVAHLVDDARAALDWSFGPDGAVADGVALAAATRSLWPTLGLGSEGERWASLALARADAATPPVMVGWLWHSVAKLKDDTGLEASIEAGRKAIEIFRAVSEPVGLALALCTVGECLVFLGRNDEAEPLLLEALDLLRTTQVPIAEISLNFALGSIRTQEGAIAEAKALFARALQVAATSGETRIALMLTVNLASAAYSMGDYDEAAERCRAVLKAVEHTPNISARALAWVNLVAALIGRGDLDDALNAAREGMPHVRKAGVQLAFLDYLALRAGRAGRLETAARLLGHANEAARQHRFDRHFHSLRVVAELETLLEAELARERLAALEAEGAALSEDQTLALALA